MKVFYFTATGNCLAAAKAIGGELISIPKALRDETSTCKDDAIGFVFPVFDNTMPRIMRELLEAKKFAADYFFAVTTYGFFPGNTLSVFQNLAATHGIALDYSAELKMVDNYLPLFDVEKEIQKITEKKTDETLARICADIAERKHALTRNTIFKSASALALKPLLKKTDSGLAAHDFTVNGDCILCGTCAKVCPAGNITVKEQVAFADRCYSCFACLHACPKNALHIKGERSSKRWRNPEVKLKELIDANSCLPK